MYCDIICLNFSLFI